MIYCGDYKDILEDSLIEELEWFKEEFEILFKVKKQNPTEKDKSLAKKIIKVLLEKMDIPDDIRIQDIIIEVLETIEYNFSTLF